MNLRRLRLLAGAGALALAACATSAPTAESVAGAFARVSMTFET